MSPLRSWLRRPRAPRLDAAQWEQLCREVELFSRYAPAEREMAESLRK